MPARSLLAMSTRVVIQHLRGLTDIGNIPYSLAKRFLVKIESPAQLRDIEKNSPHIMEEDRELWINFIKRDVPRWEEYKLPKESACWYDIYSDLVERVQREVDEDSLRLKQAVDKIYSEKATIFVRDTTRLAAPRRGWQPSQTTRSYEPKKTGFFNTKRNKALAVPTHRLNNTGASQIRNVPQWLVDEHKQPPPAAAAPRRAVPTGTPRSSTPGVSSSRTSGAIAPPRSSARPQTAQSASRPAASPTRTQQTPGSRPILTARRPTGNRPSGALSSPSGASTASRPPASLAPAPIRKRPIPTEPNVFMQPKKKRRP